MRSALSQLCEEVELEQRIHLDGPFQKVTLSMPPDGDLNWNAVAVPEEGKIFWELDLGLGKAVTPLRSSTLFYSLARGIEHFAKEMLPLYRERTVAAALYRGDLCFEERICWEQEQVSGNRRLYAARLMADYLKRLLSFLPDDLLVVALLELKGEMQAAELMQLLSRSAWEHLVVALSGSDLPVAPLVWDGEEKITSRWKESELPSLGLLLPDDEVWSEESLSWVNQAVKKIKSPFRVVPELLLTQDWEGLDQLMVLQSALTRQGARMVQGFVESGGIVF